MRWNVLVVSLALLLLGAFGVAIFLTRAPVVAPAGAGDAPGGAEPLAPGVATGAERPAPPQPRAVSGLPLNAVQPPVTPPPPPPPEMRPPPPNVGFGAPLPSDFQPPPPGAYSPRATGGPDAGAPFPMSREGIQGAIRAHIGDIRDCYESWLQSNPQLAGTMKVSFRIHPNEDGGPGVVDAVTVLDGGIGQVAMEGCVLNVMQDLRFDTPAGSDPVSVTYPFKFATTGDGPH